MSALQLDVLFFILSLLAFAFIAYIVGMLWFTGSRDPYLKTFSALGVLVATWTLTNGIGVISIPETMPYLYPFRMLFVCVVPYVHLLYMLHFSESKLAKSRAVSRTLIGLAVADVFFLLTNPLHHQFILGYDGFRPLSGGLFMLHAIPSYLALVLSFGFFLMFILKRARKEPVYLLTCPGVLSPFVLNLFFTFSNAKYDLTPVGFFLMFASFAAFSVKFRLFNIKRTAAASIFSSLADAFLVIDSRGLVANVNPAFSATFPSIPVTLEKTTFEEVTEALENIVVDRKPADVFAHFLSPEDEFSGAELSIRTATGTLMTYSLAKSAMYERGEVVGAIITLSDVSGYRRMIGEINAQNTRLVELKDLAESASLAKSAFLANMSHEIRTPMNAIIGMTTIAKGSEDPEKVQDCLGKIETASRHLLDVINDVLDMSKIEAQKLELTSEPFSLQATVQSIAGIFQARADEKMQRLIVDIDGSTPAQINGDEFRLSQVINNLLSNAIKFTPPSGTVRLAVRALERGDETVRMEIAVEDTGIGISPERQAQLFHAFEQADNGISRKFGGTGLGLAISKRIVELMGGSIWVESDEGKGSRFIFTFDAGCCADDAEASAPSADTADYNFTGHTILLVDDVEINCEIILAMLEETGVTIDCAENGEAALSKFEAAQEKYDMIYMDIHMPVMDGYTATEKIRALPGSRAKSIPIVAMTANAFAEDIAHCKASGMNDHIAKPVDITILYQKTEQYLRARS